MVKVAEFLAEYQRVLFFLDELFVRDGRPYLCRHGQHNRRIAVKSQVSVIGGVIYVDIPDWEGPALAFVSLILIAGAILLILFTLLGGAVDKNPTYKFYFLQADTSDLGNAAARTRWTFWNACSVANGHNACPKVHPAYPFDPNRNFDTTMSFGAAFVQGRNAFRSSGRTASLGGYNFGFMWAAVACLFLATLLECVGGVTGRKDRTYTKRTGGRTFMGMGRNKSTRSRGSFIDPERQRRMEKEDSE
ncbi:MAG: hypothetical protein L6R39_006693 [Caloplaca ligustica]|nr:MAG: hypothetical protein L6R39_006693 [Caloplaca ligustica]